jgi:hypothetical protein
MLLLYKYQMLVLSSMKILYTTWGWKQYDKVARNLLTFILPVPASEYAAFIAKEQKIWKDIVKRAGIKAD